MAPIKTFRARIPLFVSLFCLLLMCDLATRGILADERER